MAKVSFLVPFMANGDKERIRGFEFVKKRIESFWPSAEICIGKNDRQLDKNNYSKPRMLNNAAKQATGDIFVILDADIVFDPEAIDLAIEMIEEDEAKWVIPFGSVQRLSEEISNKVLADNPKTTVYDYIIQDSNLSKGPGAINVIPRAAWKAVGGYDEGFKNWGVEDAAFAFALDHLWGEHIRLSHKAYHLYHKSKKYLRENKNTLRFNHYKKLANEPIKLLDFILHQKHVGEPIDFVTFYQDRRHYIDHLKPVWDALPDEAKGHWIVGRKMAEYAQGKKIKKLLIVDHPYGTLKALEHGKGLAVLAGHTDSKFCERVGRPNAIIYHGTGFVFDNQCSLQSYPGTNQNRKLTKLILTPSESIAKIERRGNPNIPVVVIGCPKLDYWHLQEPKSIGEDGPVIALAWHWRCPVAPETGTAFDHYEPILEELAKHYKVLGHGHPHIINELIPKYEAMGIEVVRQLDQVFERADLLIADATSAMYEFASLDRPVVVCNAPEYRKDQDFGTRFWKNIPGLQVNEPEELLKIVKLALQDSPEVQQIRRSSVNEVYTYTDGQCTKRAVDAILRMASY